MTKAASVVTGLVAVTVLAACSPPVTDKAGGSVVVLRLATVDGQVDSNGLQHGPAAFVSGLAEVSGHRIRVEVVTSYGGERDNATAESDLVAAIARGEVDGGWPASRAFAGAGVDGLAAIEAPLAITSLGAQRDLVAGRGAELVAESLEGSGLRGLGLLVGPLRRPLGVDRFLVTVDDWRGTRFRSYGSPVQAATIAALGGQAVEAGTDWATVAADGGLDGVELDLAQYRANGYATQAGLVVSNVVLWPKMPVLVLGEDRWDALTEEQRGWVREAAERAVEASLEGEHPEDRIAAELCERGVRFREAEPDELLSLREAAVPVHDDLSDDPREAPLLREVTSVAARHPYADVVTVEDSCRSSARLPDGTGMPAALAPVPDGTFRKEISEEDVRAAGLTNNDGTSGTWTLEVGDGRWYVSCRPLASPGVDCGGSVDDGVLDAGTFRGDEDLLWMVSDPEMLASATGCALPPDGSAGSCPPPRDPVALRWALRGDDLVFSSPDLSLGFEVVLDPYVRID